MAKPLSAAIGIDVGSHNIKIAELRAGRDRHALTAMAVVESPAEGVDQNGIFEPGAVAAAIKQAMAQSGISVKQAVIGISGQSSVVVRMLEVPKMTPAELKEHMEWEIQRNIPFAETAIVSDYAKIPDPTQPPDAQQEDVVLAVAPQSAIDTIVAVLFGAGLDPIGIDVHPMALSRMLSLDDPGEGSPVMIVDIGGGFTSIDVFRQGTLSFPRVLPIGGDTFSHAIAEALGIPMEEAEQLKREKGEVLLDRLGVAGGMVGMPPGGGAPEETQAYEPYAPFVDVAEQGPAFEVEPEPEPGGEPSVMGDVGAEGPPGVGEPTVSYPYEPEAGPHEAGEGYAGAAPVPSADEETQRVFEALLPTLEELTSEVRRSVEYFKGRGAASEIGQILLGGGGARLRNLDHFLEAALGVQVRWLDPLNPLHLAMRRQPETFAREHAPEMAIAIGMALHAFEE
jgi:type IV pilus assembly protein PilM